MFQTLGSGAPPASPWKVSDHRTLKPAYGAAGPAKTAVEKSERALAVETLIVMVYVQSH